MIDYKIDLLKPMLTAIQNYTGIETILANQNEGHRPEKPYITGYFSSIRSIDLDDISGIGENDQITVKCDKDLNLQLNCIGENSIGILDKTSNMFSDFMANLELEGLKIYYIDRGDILPLPQLRNKKYEEQSTVVLEFRIAVEFKITVDYYNKVSIEGLLKTGKKDEIINISIQ